MDQQQEARRAKGVAVAATVGNMVGITPAVSATFGVFLVPIADDFHWSRALVSGVLGLISVVSAIVYPWVGRAMDRFGSRRLLILGNAMLAGSLGLLAFTNGSPVQFYLIFALIGLAGSIPSTAMFCKVVSNWFDGRRGLMLGVTAGVGNGVGATLMPVVAGTLLGTLGWKMAYASIGGIVFLLGFPFLALFLRDTPVAAANVPASDVVNEGMSLAEAARTRAFWLLLLAVAVGAGGMTAVFTHVVPMLTDHGIGLGEATMVVAVFALVAAAWQIVTGFMLDRLRSPRVIMPMYASAIAGLLLLEFGHGTAATIWGGALLGIGLGAEFGALPYFISRYFGLRHYGSISGALYAVVILIQGVTPAMMDMSFDAHGSYILATLAIVAALALGMMLFALLPQPGDVSRLTVKLAAVA